MQQKKVVFFFPAFSSQEATAPLGILAVSTPLLRAGYQVKIIDSTITPNFQKRVLAEVEDAICLCVSLVTGPMIRETVAMARAVKSQYPDLPIVLGGWHPSLLPDQTLAAEYVDVVVVVIGASEGIRRRIFCASCKRSRPKFLPCGRPHRSASHPLPASHKRDLRFRKLRELHRILLFFPSGSISGKFQFQMA